MMLHVYVVYCHGGLLDVPFVALIWNKDMPIVVMNHQHIYLCFLYDIVVVLRLLFT